MNDSTTQASISQRIVEQTKCVYIYDVEIILQIHDRVPLGSEVKCQGVLVSSCTGSSGEIYKIPFKKNIR